MDYIIRKYKDSDLESLNILLDEVYGLTKKTNNSTNIELVAEYNNEIIGFLTLNKLHDSVEDIAYFYINYVCVKNNYRRLHVATKLLEKAIELCKEENALYIELTSNPSRLEAHSLYEKLGFKIRCTDVFRKEFI